MEGQLTTSLSTTRDLDELLSEIFSQQNAIDKLLGAKRVSFQFNLSGLEALHRLCADRPECPMKIRTLLLAMCGPKLSTTPRT